MGYRYIINTTADVDSITNSKAMIKAIELHAITVDCQLFVTRLLEGSSLIVTEPFLVLKIENTTYKEGDVEYKSTPVLTLYSEEEELEVRATPQDLFKDVLAVSLDEETASSMHTHLQENYRRDIGFQIEKYQEENSVEELDMDSIMESEFEQRLQNHNL